MAGLIEMSIGTWTWVGPRNQVLDGVEILIREGSILRAKRGRPRTCQFMSDGRYSKGLSRRQHRYDADADWGVLDGGAH